VFQQYILDLARPDLEARSDNHVLGAVYDVEPSLFIFAGEVTST
jgi:hypothetical protein